MILANEAVAELLAGRRREALFRVHERPDVQSIELLLAKLEALEVPAPPVPDHLTPAEAARLAARTSTRISEYVSQARRGEEAFPALVLRALKQAQYDPRNRALVRELGLSDEQVSADLPELAEWCSVREREAAQVEHAADAICLAWLLERHLFELGWDACFDGEITGLIGSGVFVRFDGVFEGYVPVRRLPGDYFELDPLATALVGRRTGKRYRLGDGIAVTVEGIDRTAGKVNLALCGKSDRG